MKKRNWARYRFAVEAPKWGLGSRRRPQVLLGDCLEGGVVFCWGGYRPPNEGSPTDDTPGVFRDYRPAGPHTRRVAGLGLCCHPRTRSTPGAAPCMSTRPRAGSRAQPALPLRPRSACRRGPLSAHPNGIATSERLRLGPPRVRLCNPVGRCMGARTPRGIPRCCALARAILGPPRRVLGLTTRRLCSTPRPLARGRRLRTSRLTGGSIVSAVYSQCEGPAAVRPGRAIGWACRLAVPATLARAFVALERGQVHLTDLLLVDVEGARSKSEPACGRPDRLAR